ncbi:MAG: MFS transporter, partial [Oscillospiraceae bacterium]
LMSTGIACIIFQPLFGFLVDKFCNIKTIFLCVIAVLAVSMPIFFKYSDVKAVVIVYSALSVGSLKSLTGVLDSWISKLQKQGVVLDYGKLRSVGSISYAIAAVVFGQLLAMLGNSFSAVCVVVLSAIMAPIVAMLPNPEKSEKAEMVTLLHSLGYLFSNKAYLIFLGCAILSQLTSQAAFSFYPILIKSFGGGVGEVGFAYFVMAASEFLVILNFTKISKRFGATRLLGMGYIGYFVKSFILSIVPTLALALAASSLQAISFAFVIPGAVAYLYDNIDRKYLASAQLLYQTVCASLMQIFASPVYGNVSQKIGVQKMLGVFSVFALVGGVLFLIMAGRKKHVREDLQV